MGSTLATSSGGRRATCTKSASVAERAETAASELAPFPGLGLETISQFGPHGVPSPVDGVPAASLGAAEVRAHISAPMRAALRGRTRPPISVFLGQLPSPAGIMRVTDAFPRLLP